MSNVENIEGIFSYCSSLVSLPDISKWENNQINSDDLKKTSEECLSCLNIPK